MRTVFAAMLSCAVVLFGCTVEDEFLDDDLFICDGPSVCGEGWGCQRATPYTENFCAPDCDESCDGICTGGDESLCLRGCLIDEAGHPGACQSEDFACIRTSVERDEGVCYPVQSCETDDDCGPQEICLTQYLRDLNEDSPWRLDNMYCIPRADDAGRCPPGSAPPPFLRPGATPLCLPSCSVIDPRCPPAMACLTQLQQIAPLVDEIDGPSCVIGTYGLACQDDTNCFFGRCLDTGTAQGRICTLTCNEASAIVGGAGCEGLLSPNSLSGLFARLECDPGAPSEDGSGLCVVRYKMSYPGCTSDPGSAYECIRELECRRITVGPTEITLCTKSCTTDAECNEGGGPNPERWLYECHTGLGICLFRDDE